MASEADSGISQRSVRPSEVEAIWLALNKLRKEFDELKEFVVEGD